MTCPFSWRGTGSADQRFQLSGSASSSVAPGTHRDVRGGNARPPLRAATSHARTSLPAAQRRCAAPPSAVQVVRSACSRRRTPQPAGVNARRAMYQDPRDQHLVQPAATRQAASRSPAPGLRPDAPYRDLRPYGLLARATPKCCISRATRSPWVSGTMWPPLGSVTKGASARHQSSGAIRSCGPRRI